MRIKDLNIIITGGSSGLGWATVTRLSQQNKVFILDLSEPPIKLPNVQFFKADLTEFKTVSEVFSKIF